MWKVEKALGPSLVGWTLLLNLPLDCRVPARASLSETPRGLSITSDRREKSSDFFLWPLVTSAIALAFALSVLERRTPGDLGAGYGLYSACFLFCCFRNLISSILL